MEIDFVSLIKEYRSKNYLSQEDFANLIGVSYISVNRWENGHFTPTLKVKRKLHSFFVKEGMINE